MNVTKRLVILLLVCSSCSGVRVLNTDADPGFQLNSYKTFDFFQITGQGDTSFYFKQNVKLLKESIVQKLQDQRSDTNFIPARFAGNIGVVVEEKIQTCETDFRDAPRYMAQRNYTWKSEEIEVGRYREGTVAFHLVDPSTKKLIWKGAVAGVIPNKQKNVPATMKKVSKHALLSSSTQKNCTYRRGCPWLYFA
jgi:hypothetical protein